MIRVLHMIGSLNIGGSQAMIMNLYRNIDREQIQFDFILDHPDQLFFAEEVKSLGGKIYFMPEFTGINLLDVRKAWNRFFREHPEYKILHSHVRSYASVYLSIARRYGVKTIIHSHSTSNGKGIKSLVKRIMQYPLRYQTDYCFSCSQEAGEWLFGKKIASQNRHFIVRNAIDAEKFRYNEDVRREYRAMLGVTDQTVYVHVGRFHPAKNHDFLLRVFSQIHARNSNTVLLLLGDGELRTSIEKKIQEMGLQNAVHLLGGSSEVHKWLQAADCFLFPSLWEGLGIVVVEAQAAGLPCVCSNQVPSLVKVMDSCRFIPLDEAKWVAVVMVTTLDRQDSYDQIVAAGYDVHATSQWLYEFYSKLWRN